MSNPFLAKPLLFSIISPCYGWAWQCLAKNAQTLSEQEYKAFEWIVVFDGESKPGERAMHKIKAKYPEMNIAWHTIAHGGAPKARNYGATQAKGDIFVFLNSDNYLYTEALRVWASAYDEHPEINRVWGLYDNLDPSGQKIDRPIGQAPMYPDGRVWYKAFQYSNYCDSTFPIRRKAYIPWDETVKSLQDWDWAIRQLKRDNFQGKDWLYIPHSFFVAEAVRKGGLSDDSHQHWIERTNYIRNKNGLPKADICVVSHGAAHHGFHVAEKLKADYLPMPSFKRHQYKMIYLLGFYTAEDPSQPGLATRSHMEVFANAPKDCVKVIHWIGSDILQLRWNCGFEKIKAIKRWLKREKIISLTEADFTQKELAEVGIKSHVVPIPGAMLHEVMPLPQDFTVGVYLPSLPNGHPSPIYKEDFIMEIVRAMPDVQFYFFGSKERAGEGRDNWQHLGYISMEEWLPKLSCNLRLTVHDGLPLLPIEFMTAGRHAVVNVPLAQAESVKAEREEVVAALRKVQSLGINQAGHDYWMKTLSIETYVKRIRSLIVPVLTVRVVRERVGV